MLKQYISFITFCTASIILLLAISTFQPSKRQFHFRNVLQEYKSSRNELRFVMIDNVSNMIFSNCLCNQKNKCMFNSIGTLQKLELNEVLTFSILKSFVFCPFPSQTILIKIINELNQKLSVLNSDFFVHSHHNKS